LRVGPGTGAAENGGPFAFVGAHYGSLWGVPAGPNNSMGVGYCVMEDVDGEGTSVFFDYPPHPRTMNWLLAVG